MKTLHLLLKIFLRFALLADDSMRCPMLDERLIIGDCSYLDERMLCMSNGLQGL